MHVSLLFEVEGTIHDNHKEALSCVSTGTEEKQHVFMVVQ